MIYVDFRNIMAVLETLYPIGAVFDCPDRSVPGGWWQDAVVVHAAANAWCIQPQCLTTGLHHLSTLYPCGLKGHLPES